MSQHVAILCAMTEETDAVIRAGFIEDRQEDFGGYIVRIGTLDGHDVVLATTGIGKVNAAACMSILATQFDLRVVFFSGVAGAIEDGIDIGDIVVGQEVSCYDYGHLGAGKFTPSKPGCLPLASSPQWIWAMSEKLLSSVTDGLLQLNETSDLAGKLYYGRIVTGDLFVASDVMREKLRTVHGATVVEMETAAVALVATKFAIPFVPIRSISDKASGEAPADFMEFLHAAADRAIRVVRHLLPLV